MPLQFAQTVATPNAAPAVTPVNTAALANLPDAYNQGATEAFQRAQQQRQLAIQGAFSGGLPTDASGNPNYGAAAQKLISLGDFGDASNLMQFGLRQRLMAGATNDPLLGGGSSQNANGTPAPAAGNASGQPANGQGSDYNTITAKIESSGGKASDNLYQFQPATWTSLRAAHPELNLPASVADATPQQQLAAQSAFTGDNGGVLKQNGIPVSDRTLTMAHFLGPTGAVKFFQAAKQDPNQPAATIFPKEAAANKALFYDADGNPLSIAAVFRNRAMQFGSGLTAFAPVTANDGAGNGAAVPLSAPQGAPVAGAPANGVPGAVVSPVAANGGAPQPTQPIPSAPVSPTAPRLSPMTPSTFPTDQSYINALMMRANQYALAGNQEGAKVYTQRAQMVADSAKQQAEIGQQHETAELRFGAPAAGARAAAVAANTPTQEQKNFAAFGLPGETQAQYEARIAGSKATAEQNAKVAAEPQIAEADASGKALGELPGQYASSAANAKLANNQLDEMGQAAQNFRMGWGADSAQDAKAMLKGMGDMFNIDTSNLAPSVANYQDFLKQAGNIVRQSAHEVGSRTGVQEMQLISKSLPSPEMSPEGFGLVASQLKGQNDYLIAKQQAAQSWQDAHQKSLYGFESAWNQNVSPGAFVAHRMQLENPNAFQTMVQNMAKAPGGKAVLTNLKSELGWANQNGLFGN